MGRVEDDEKNCRWESLASESDPLGCSSFKGNSFSWTGIHLAATLERQRGKVTLLVLVPFAFCGIVEDKVFSLVFHLAIQDWLCFLPYSDWISEVTLFLWFSETLVFLDLEVAPYMLSSGLGPVFISVVSRAPVNGGGWFSFPPCCYILPLIKVKVESGIFQGRGEGNFGKCVFFFVLSLRK